VGVIVKRHIALFDSKKRSAMRFTSILSFVLTVAIGVGLAQVLPIRVRPFTEWVRPTEWLRPSLSLEEGETMLGHRVRCIHRTDTFSGGCEIGERGDVIAVQRAPDGGYFIVVRWSDHGRGELSYYGRYSRRVVLAEE
jgi:hypothetical protein